ncbi:MAG: hypothetical protein AAGI17_02520 [Planctomycetota bacterium]
MNVELEIHSPEHAYIAGIPDASIGSISIINTLEFFDPRRTDAFLTDLRRIAAPGCALRIAAPDLRAAAEARARGDRAFFDAASDPERPLDLLFADWMYARGPGGSRRCNCYDAESLQALLRNFGFACNEIDSANGELRAELSTPIAEVRVTELPLTA